MGRQRSTLELSRHPGQCWEDPMRHVRHFDVESLYSILNSHQNAPKCPCIANSLAPPGMYEA